MHHDQLADLYRALDYLNSITETLTRLALDNTLKPLTNHGQHHAEELRQTLVLLKTACRAAN